MVTDKALKVVIFLILVPKILVYVNRGFLSVVVITCASHAQGRRFEPGRKHKLF